MGDRVAVSAHVADLLRETIAASAASAEVPFEEGQGATPGVLGRSLVVGVAGVAVEPVVRLGVAHDLGLGCDVRERRLEMVVYRPHEGRGRGPSAEAGPQPRLVSAAWVQGLDLHVRIAGGKPPNVRRVGREDYATSGLDGGGDGVSVGQVGRAGVSAAEHATDQAG